MSIYCASFLAKSAFFAVLFWQIASTAVPGNHIIYKHFPKAGGTFALQVLQETFGKRNVMHCNEIKALAECRSGNEQDFVIANTRNPLTYYISLWAYNSDGRGGFRVNWLPENSKLRKKDDKRDSERLREWIHMVTSANLGYASLRFYRSFVAPKTPAPLNHRTSVPIKSADLVAKALAKMSLENLAVDCWVDEAYEVIDLQYCVRMFAERSNTVVRWEDFARATKNARQNKSSHKDCTDYYNTTSEGEVRELDKEMYRVFGFEGCGSWPRENCTAQNLDGPRNMCINI
jgi:hypothetical protein